MEFTAEYKFYDRDDEGEQAFSTLAEAETWLMHMARYSSTQTLTGWINGKRVTATTVGITYESFGVAA